MFADMAWYTRKIAAVIFASPPTSTYEEVSSVRKEINPSVRVDWFMYLFRILRLPKCGTVK